MESKAMDDGVSNRDLYDMIYGPDEPPFTTTPTDHLPAAAATTISNQMPSSPSAPTFIPTPTLNTINPNQNDQMLDWDLQLDDHDVIVSNYPTTPDTSMSSAHVTTTINNIIPTTSTQVMLLDNHRALEDTIYWDQPGLCSKTHAPSFTTQTQTTNTPAVTINHHDWMDSSFSSTILNYPGNSSSSSSTNFQGENNLNQLLFDQSLMNVKQKQPLSSKNWPILTIPILGKLTDITTHKPQKPPVFSTQTPSDPQTQSKSTQWKKREKRVYKMPMTALKNDVWSWRKYGEKSVDGSPYPRVYYKCNSSKECTAKRRVEQNKSDPTLVCLKYTGRHNHQIPMFMASSSSCSGNEKDNPNSPSGTTEKKKDETIYGMGNFVDLEKNKT